MLIVRWGDSFIPIAWRFVCNGDTALGIRFLIILGVLSIDQLSLADLVFFFIGVVSFENNVFFL